MARGRPRHSEEEASVRINVRIPPALYKNIMELGGTLGQASPASAVRYFLTLGVQASMGSIGAVRVQQQIAGWSALLTAAAGESSDAAEARPVATGGPRARRKRPRS